MYHQSIKIEKSMNKVILSFTLLFSVVFHTNGAIPNPDIVLGSISGRVIDNVQKQPVSYAAIVIKRSSDNTTITGGITNEDGTFQIKKLPEGDLFDFPVVHEKLSVGYPDGFPFAGNEPFYEKFLLLHRR